MVTNNHLGACTILHDEKVAVMQQGIEPGHGQVYHLHSLIQDLSLWYVYKQSVKGKGRIQGNQSIRPGAGMFGKMLLHKVRVLPEGFGQAADNDTVIQPG